VAFDVALIACPVMQFYCGTPMYLLSGVDKPCRCHPGAATQRHEPDYTLPQIL